MPPRRSNRKRKPVNRNDDDENDPAPPPTKKTKITIKVPPKEEDTNVPVNNKDQQPMDDDGSDDDSSWSSDCDEQEWKNDLPLEFQKPNRNRQQPDEEMYDDLARDYVEGFKAWRKLKKTLVVLYNEAAIMNDKMICENCKEIIDVNTRIRTGKGVKQSSENSHVSKIIEKEGELYEVFSCQPCSYNQYFMQQVAKLGEESSSEDDSEEEEEDE